MLSTVCGTVYASKGRLVVISFGSLRLKTLGHNDDNLVGEKQTLVLRLLCKFRHSPHCYLIRSSTCAGCLEQTTDPSDLLEFGDLFLHCISYVHIL